MKTFLALCILIFFSCGNENKKEIQIQKGILNYQNQVLPENWIISLIGEWEIYPDHFYYSSDFTLKENELLLKTEDSGYIHNPGTWVDYKRKNGKRLNSFGFSTQRIIVKLDRNYPKLALRIPDIFSAYRIFINGKLISSKGIVSVSELESEPELGSSLVEFEANKDELEIIIHISNFFHYRAGMVRALELGTIDTLKKNHDRKLFFDMIVFGSLMIVGLYNFGLYISRTKEKTPLVFSLYCFGHMIRSGFTNERILLVLFPSITSDIAVRVNYIVLASAPFVTLLMFRYIFPIESSRRFLILSAIFSILELGTVLFSKSIVFTSLGFFYESIVIGTIIYIVIIILKAMKQSRIGAKTLFAGFFIISLTGIHDILLFRNIIVDSFYYSPYSFLLFILCQAVVIARKTTYAIEYSEILSGNLEKSNLELLNLRDQLEYKVEQRTKELKELMEISENEKSKSDKLLLNILPREVAEQLKETGKVAPVYYNSATVMFTDFHGFTKIAERLKPSELISELDNCFTEFDKICKHYGLEKLKTIGDSYMCAAGLPSPKKTHAIDACIVAIAIREFMKELKRQKISEGKEFWELRIGIHSGPLVAGVIGQEKFAYDVWGDAVNIACRMEEAGEKSRINISGNTYNAIMEFFECEYRGKIKAKNKGEVDMYFVNRILPKYSNDPDGIVPNFDFYDRYGDILYNDIKPKNPT